MTKFYRVTKDTFLWKEGAILEENQMNNGSYGYQPIEDIWDVTDNGSEYISASIIEAVENKEWFERVYRDTISGKIFKTADQMKKTYSASFKK